MWEYVWCVCVIFRDQGSVWDSEFDQSVCGGHHKEANLVTGPTDIIAQGEADAAKAGAAAKAEGKEMVFLETAVQVPWVWCQESHRL